MKILSIIIPVFNEEKTVGVLLKKVVDAKLPAGINKEIIIIDDGSTDNTLNILQGQVKIKFKLIRHGNNLGKGAAIRSGLRVAKGDFIIIQDADLEYDPADYTKLLKPVLDGKSEVVYGTRLLNYPLKLWGKNKTVLPSHLLGNKLLTFITNFLYGSNLTDMETCYKLFTRNVLSNLRLKSNKFDIEPEITTQILKNKFSILEIPIKVIPRTNKEGKKITWKDGFKAIFTLLEYKFHD